LTGKAEQEADKERTETRKKEKKESQQKKPHSGNGKAYIRRE